MKHLVIIALALAALASCATSNRGSSGNAPKVVSEEYCMWMDSLVRSEVYSFRPQYMQVQPAGRRQQISSSSRMDVYEDYIDLNLPFITGIVGPFRRTSLTYILSNVNEYKSERSADGKQWTVTYSDTLFSSTVYNFKLTVTVCSGDAVLEISSSTNRTITYHGYLRPIY